MLTLFVGSSHDKSMKRHPQTAGVSTIPRLAATATCPSQHARQIRRVRLQTETCAAITTRVTFKAELKTPKIIVIIIIIINRFISCHKVVTS